MKTPITYYGGKQQLVPTILPMIPSHRLYVEPYFGGGAVFFAKKPSYLEVINDINENETVKAVREKIEDTVEQLTSNETVQQAKEFVSEQTDRAGEFVKESAESIEKSGFMQKLKSLFGLK